MTESKPSITLQRILQKLTAITTNVYGLDTTFRLIQYTAHLLSIYTPKGSAVHRASVRAQSPFSDARFALRLFSSIHLLAAPPRPGNWSHRLLLAYAVAELAYWLAQHQIGLAPTHAARWSRVSCAAWALWIVLELARDRATWLRQATELPMAIHWSAHAFLPDTAVAWLGFIGGCTGFCHAWKQVKL